MSTLDAFEASTIFMTPIVATARLYPNMHHHMHVPTRWLPST